jgi:trans-L-3-hydroxyproline dehydratase
VATLKTIDAHAGGEPLRLIVDGFPAPRGKTMLEKQAWAARRADHLRRAVMLEPRGHIDMTGAVLTEPVTPGSHAGILFLDADGYTPFTGHGIIAATTIALERALLMPGGDGRTIVFDTPSGTVRATASSSGAGVRVEQVTFTGVPSFVMYGGVEIALGPRRVRVDLAFGGAFFAIVDGESAGLPLDASHLPELRRAGMQIREAVERTVNVTHPGEPRLEGIHGTVFTGPPNAATADLRNVAVLAGGQVDRSASGVATAAVMAVIDAMGLLDEGRPFVHESIVDTTISGRVAGRTQVGDYAAIVPEITGDAWITGEHTFLIDERDPLREGIRI